MRYLTQAPCRRSLESAGLRIEPIMQYDCPTTNTNWDQIAPVTKENCSEFDT
jgi:hypothetical protein